MLLRINCDPNPGPEQLDQLASIYEGEIDLTDSGEIKQITLQIANLATILLEMVRMLSRYKVGSEDLIELGAAVDDATFEGYCRFYFEENNQELLPLAVRATIDEDGRFRCYEGPDHIDDDGTVIFRDF